jgi:hypothetical protein
MLIHTSIAANDPDRVSKVLCEVAGGKRCSFPYPGGYYVGFDDDNSTAVEVYPIDTQLQPGPGPSYGELSSTETSRQKMVRYVGSGETVNYLASHIALSTPLGLEEIYAIAEREHWRASYCARRDSFRLVEFWLENRVLVELVLEEDLADAIAALKVDVFDSDHRKLGVDLQTGAVVKKPA